MQSEIEIIKQSLEEVKREFTHLSRQKISPDVRKHLVAMWEQFRTIYADVDRLGKNLENPFLYPAADAIGEPCEEDLVSLNIDIDLQQGTETNANPSTADETNPVSENSDTSSSSNTIIKDEPKKPSAITRLPLTPPRQTMPAVSAHPKILVIDDCENTQNILAFTLKKKGYDVEAILDPTKALDKVLDWRPELILLDLMMPQMDGFEVLKILRANRDCDSIQIIVGSSRSYDKDRLTVLGLGANDFIAKPYNVKELGLRIRNFLQSAAEPRKLSA